VSSRLSIVAATVLAAATLGGCASGKVREANTYVKAVNRAQLSFAASSTKLVAQITPDSKAAEDRRALQRFYGAVDGFVARLKAIKPPARVRALHARLIAALVTFGQNLRTAGAGLTSKNAGRILDGQQQLAAASARVTHAINATIAAINGALKG
jgi:type VI protein secretion system component VasF